MDNCILVKASVEDVSTIIKEYFELEVRSNCKLAQYIEDRNAAWQEIERQRLIRKPRHKSSIVWGFPFWRYLNHQWTIMPVSGTKDSIAFVLAALLDTNTITFHDDDNACFSEFKVFHSSKFIEHYLFGLECGKMLEEEYWDTIVDFEHYPYWFSGQHHHFKSSIRQVTEAEIKLALEPRKHNRDDRGFLDACLKYHEAYIPIIEETPYHYHGERNLDFKSWDSTVERMDIILVSSNDWKNLAGNAPNRVL